MLNLTPQERQVILFLIILLLSGIGIDFLGKRYSRFKAVAYINQDIGRIDLNKADKEALIGIAGIGEKLARRIIEYRRQQGSLSGIEELKNIKGLKGNKYEAIKDYFVIE